jgi:3D-(3,5/4)-trihydroxycyclohexane-1,2-dione acylhydrolase (decyclizing)
MMAIPFTVVLTDNRGYGCINRLQKGTGGVGFNNLLDDSYHVNPAQIDFVAHARSMGALVIKVGSIVELETEMQAAKAAKLPTVIVIDTDPMPGTGAGGTWWDVAVPEVSTRTEVNEARKEYEEAAKRQWLVN